MTDHAPAPDDGSGPGRILVTGGGGFLGFAICRQLVQRGYAVRSFSRGDYPALRELGVETARGDLGDAAAVDAAVQGCETVFHVAALAGIWGAKADFWRANAEGTAHIIAACQKHGVRRLVYTSSPSVVQTDGDCEGADESLPYSASHRTHYQASKAEGERLVLAANGPELWTTALRPRLIWGPGDNHLVPRLVARAKAGRVRLVGGGLGKVDTIFISDAAAAHLCALDRLLGAGSEPPVCAGRAYFISSGEPLPFHEVLNRILIACDGPEITRSISPGLAFFAGCVLEAAWTILPLSGEPPMTRFLALQLATANWYDIGAARRDLGFSPQVSFAAGLTELGAWWRARA
ncbi:MAG: NAD-dependent epimerase/dehydratase family protein [Myxococcales bacterium]|nr:NAD-dependent epimerase/dehydratase family protein [Myxococcales bacterium]